MRLMNMLSPDRSAAKKWLVCVGVLPMALVSLPVRKLYFLLASCFPGRGWTECSFSFLTSRRAARCLSRMT